MRRRSIAFAAAAGVMAAWVLLAGCGPTKTPEAGQSTTASTSASPTTAVIKDITPGNCTLYAQADAIKLLGAVNMNNKAIDINTDGGTKIDVCSYMNFSGGQTLEGVSYAVVRYDSGATAFAEAQKVQADMLD